MFYLLYVKVAEVLAALANNAQAITSVVIASIGFLFFLGCMGRAVGMNITFNAAILFTALFAGCRMLFRGFRWFFRTLARVIRGTFTGTENTLLKFGVTAGKSRLAAILVTGLVIVAII
jgi:CBS domain containing-hemolysin-like protein